jgi:hypothetical protein
MNASSPGTEVFARLPVGRSTAVRALLIVGGLITAACVFWIQQLRMGGDLHGLAPIFFVLFTFFDHGAATLALGILLVAVFIPRWDGFDALLRSIGQRPYMIGGAVAVLSSIGTLVIYHNQPLSMDEYAAVFQSKAFAAGHLSGRFSPDLLNLLIPEGFQQIFLGASKTTGEVASKYWPSFALLLTPFSLLGISWACNGVLSGITIVVLNKISRRLFQSAEAAGLVTLFTIASPVFFADGISYYSMTAHMLANAIFALLLLKPTTRRLVAAGIVGSIALTLHNPVPHALFALPWFVWLATQERPVSKLAALCAGYVPLSLLLGIGWFWYLGNLTQTAGPAAGTVDSVGSTIANAFALPTGTVYYARLVGLAKILLWSTPCLLILAAAGAWRSRLDSRMLTFTVAALLTLAGYLFVPADQGHGWGFRYFHSAWLVLPLLATAFLFPLAKKQRPEAASGSTLPATADLRAYVVACALLSLFVGVGVRASQMNDFITDHLSQYPHYAGIEPRIVVQNGTGFYAYDLVQNDPFLRQDVVHMVNVGEDATAAAIKKHFPTYHRVHADQYGEIWSAAPPSSSIAHNGAPRDSEERRDPGSAGN